MVGILAARIKDRYHRPVIAFARDGERELRGPHAPWPGARARCARRGRGGPSRALSRFGGHAMAAGLTLEHARFDAFSRAFDTEVRRHVSESALRSATLSDGGSSRKT